MRRVIMTAVAALSIVAALPGAALAGDPEVKKEGPCSGRSEWKLEVRLEDSNRFRVRWEADSGVAGRDWRLTLRKNGNVIASAVRTTNADGEAQLNLRGVSNPPGKDTFSGFARRIGAAETCSGSVRI
jgi:uncharacterized protein YfaP (DUF2135 family)